MGLAMNDTPVETHCGYAALIGAPNAGKSTLLNALVGAKVSIVSRKAQTTRTRVRGVAIEGAAQIVFVDTPGLFRPKRRLDRAMVDAAWKGADEGDALVLVIDARRVLGGLDEENEAILTALDARRAPVFLALNKVDLVPRPKLLELAQSLNARRAFAATFMTSAETGDGVAAMRETLAESMPKGPWLYPEDQISEAPLMSLAAEITREKLFERLHDELPYQTTVETEQWEQRKDGSARVEQTIYVTREGHRKIVIGEGGRTLKAIGTAARQEIAEANEGPVHLFLHVKLREHWLDDPERYRAMGLEFPKE
jgi:GTPase